MERYETLSTAAIAPYLLSSVNDTPGLGFALSRFLRLSRQGIGPRWWEGDTS